MSDHTPNEERTAIDDLMVAGSVCFLVGVVVLVFYLVSFAFPNDGENTSQNILAGIMLFFLLSGIIICTIGVIKIKKYNAGSNKK